MLLKTTTDQNIAGQQNIPVQHSVVPNVVMPNAVGSIQHMPVNNVISHYPPAVLAPPAFPLPVGPYVCFPPEIHFPVHQAVVTESGSIQTPGCQVVVPQQQHCYSQDSSRLLLNSRVPEEERVQETRAYDPLQQPTYKRTDDRESSYGLDDTSYRDKILGDDISRERREKRLMKEKIQQWKIRDGVDSDTVEFERLRTPHRSIIDAGMFFAFLYL